MMTGNNPGLAARLLLVQFNRIGRGGPKTWIDAGYCIDAPNTLAAGSTERDQFGQDEDDLVDMPTTIERESPNAEASGARSVPLDAPVGRGKDMQ